MSWGARGFSLLSSLHHPKTITESGDWGQGALLSRPLHTGGPLLPEIPSSTSRNGLLSSWDCLIRLGPLQREKGRSLHSDNPAWLLYLLFYLPDPISCLLRLVVARGRRPHVASELLVTLLPSGALWSGALETLCSALSSH